MCKEDDIKETEVTVKISKYDFSISHNSLVIQKLWKAYVKATEKEELSYQEQYYKMLLAREVTK